MKHKFVQAVCAAAAIIIVLAFSANPVFCASPDDEAEKIISYQLESLKYDDIQGFIDGWLSEMAGSSDADWLACALARRGSCDFSAYNTALAVRASEGNPSERLRKAISALMTGGSVDAEAILEENYGKLGIMSEIYGLHIMKISGIGDTDSAVADILSRQLSDGGWSLSGNISDPDVTAMALQALAGMNDCETAINNALNRLSALQQPDGGYRSFGNPTSESCSQVIAALSALGINPLTDTRFIKSGRTVFDALLSYRTASGGFSHLHGGKVNQIATVQALIALTSMGVGNFYKMYKPAPTESTLPTTIADTEERPHEIEPTTIEVTLSSGSNMTELAATEETNEAEETVETVAVTISEVTVHSTFETISTHVEYVEKKNENTPESSVYAEFSTQTETTVTIAAALNNDTPKGSSSQPWKVTAIAVIAVGWGGCLLFLVARKNLSVRKTIGGTIAATICICTVLVTKIQTPEEYYSRHIDEIGPDSLTFSLTVSIGQIGDEGHAIVPKTDFVLLDGETAFSALERILAYKKVALDYTGNTITNVYIRGIDGVYEFEHGETAGWMYRVNGVFPSVGCGNFVLHDGDRVEFLYTTNMGKDLGAEEYTK